jgi:hypothetical protein
MIGYPTQQLNPYGATFFGAQGTPSQNPNITQSLQQVIQALQFLPHQVQQLQQLQYVQHQQLQQLLHTIPMQLAQLQQLIQFVPQQVISTPWGLAPQAIGAQPSQVM